MDSYFDTMFHSTLWVLPIAIVLFLLLKFNIVYKDHPAKEKYLSFTKKLVLIGIPVLVVSYLLTNGGNNNKRENYINQCVADNRIGFLNADQKNLACPCSHDYLHAKYGDKIYTSEQFNFTLEDNKEMIICFLRAKRPNITDCKLPLFSTTLK
jgi:hypothetical protein